LHHEATSDQVEGNHVKITTENSKGQLEGALQPALVTFLHLYQR